VKSQGNVLTLAAVSDFVIRDALLGPCLQNLVDCDALGATEFFIMEVGIVDGLPDRHTVKTPLKYYVERRAAGRSLSITHNSVLSLVGY
jgi:hypothetical protein